MDYKVEIELDSSDLKKLHSYIGTKLIKNHPRAWSDRYGINLLIWFLVVWFVAIPLMYIDFFHWPTAIFLIAIFSISLLSYFYRMKRVNKTVMNYMEKYSGKYQFEFNQNGFRSLSDGYKFELSWSRIEKIERIKGMIIIYLDYSNAFVFPEKKLTDPDSFMNYLNSVIKAYNLK